ncbi:UNVERIFIED_CONTAM: hypothetical protein K2H54_066255 [Gekko kuhli]
MDAATATSPGIGKALSAGPQTPPYTTRRIKLPVDPSDRRQRCCYRAAKPKPSLACSTANDPSQPSALSTA